jgi:hypothetical protein
MKKHPFFDHILSACASGHSSVWDWLNQESHQSPLLALAQLEQEEIIKEGLDAVIVDSFTATFEDSCEWLTSIMQS